MICLYKSHCRLECPEQIEVCQSYRDRKRLDRVFDNAEQMHLIPANTREVPCQKGWRAG